MAIDRKAKTYAITCPNCSKERRVTYAQWWNVDVGNSTGRCNSCRSKQDGTSRYLRGIPIWNKGLKISGMSGHFQSLTQRLTKSLMNYIDPIADKPGVREKMSLAKKGRCGELASRWEGGKTKGQHIRMTAPFKEWRIKILKRDSYKCQRCGQVSKDLHVHHIQPFSLFPDLRLDIANGITLCKWCHKNIHRKNELLYGVSA